MACVTAGAILRGGARRHECIHTMLVLDPSAKGVRERAQGQHKPKQGLRLVEPRCSELAMAELQRVRRRSTGAGVARPLEGTTVYDN